MAKVEFFGQFRLNAGKDSIILHAETIKDLIEFIVQDYPNIEKNDLIHANIFLNGKPLQGLRRSRKRISEDDTVFFMNPACGG